MGWTTHCNSSIFISLVRKVNLLEVLTGLKTTFLFTMIGFALSPVLYKLTDTISTDTIHSMAMASFFLHLLTSDYGLSAPTVSWQISLNAAVFSSVRLASRFDHHLSAFSLLSLSVFCFLILLEMGGPGLTVYRNAVFTYLKEKP
jgi:hypothetical protein